MKNFKNMLALTDDIANTCYYGISETVTYDFTTFKNEVGYNILFNAGYMFTDVLYMVQFPPDSIPNYSYNLANWIGDFIIRFFYREPILII